MNELGKVIIGLGLLLVVLGALMQVPKLFDWLGRLPGDIRVGNTTVLLGTGLAISIIVTVVLNLLAVLFRKR